MLWLDKKYANLVGSSLRNFKWKDSKVASFSCPLCGDSQTDARKARGFLYVARDKKTNSDGFVFHCHNCGKTKPFRSFLAAIDATLYDEYNLERMKEKYTTQPKTPTQPFKMSPPVFKSRKDTENLIPITTLPKNHQAVEYVLKRKLPPGKLLWTDKFADVIHELDPEYKIEVKNEPRLCLLLKDTMGTITGIIGRSLSSKSGDKYRYLTIKFDKDVPKLFGLENHSREKPTFVVEGPLDSLLLPNAIAMCGGSVSFEVLEQYIDKERSFVALDNEPRKKETVSKMLKFVDHGYRLVVWTGISSEYKDINDMIVKGGMTKRDVLSHIAKNSFTGLAATNEINSWKKCKIF